MKRLYYLMLITVSVFSAGCRKVESNHDSFKYGDMSPKELFAKALSCAVYDSEPLRSFIKEEALKEFDKDYDVFYPFVKDREVYSGKTFRSIMLDYLPEDTLSQIEKELPLLNILVPDWEWLEAFSVNEWDVNDSGIIVGFSDKSKKHRVYYHGELFEELELGMFPENPILIVTENERMKVVSHPTKDEMTYYEFSHDCFRPDIETKKVTPETKYYYLQTNPGSEYVDTAAFISDFPEIVEGWKEYGTNPFSAQRNYAYFGLRNGATEGILNPKIRESIIAIKLLSTNCMDDVSGGTDYDSMLRDHKYSSPINEEATQDLINAVWGAGQLEIQLIATVVDKDGNTKILNNNIIPVHAKNLFDITKIQRDFYHKTLFQNRYYKYIGRYVDLVPKWYYLETPLSFNKWDPSTESTIINVHAYEADRAYDEEITETIKMQRGVKVNGKTGDKFNLSFEFDSDVTNYSASYTIHHDSDDLSSKEMYYNDDVILSVSDGKYRLKTYSTGALNFIMVPTTK